MGLNRVADYGDALIGLDDKGLRAVVATVLAERERFRERLARMEPPDA